MVAILLLLFIFGGDSVSAAREEVRVTGVTNGPGFARKVLLFLRLDLASLIYTFVPIFNHSGLRENVSGKKQIFVCNLF